VPVITPELSVFTIAALALSILQWFACKQLAKGYPIAKSSAGLGETLRLPTTTTSDSAVALGESSADTLKLLPPASNEFGSALTESSADIGKPSLPGERLRPAEIAYLARHGDRMQALLVLGADILQRVIKAQISDKPVPPQAGYERQALTMAKDQVSDWARNWAARKAGELIPPDARKDPIGFAKGISRTYAFFAMTIRSFIANTLKDPWQIRNYISLSGVARLILSISVAGYQNALEDGIRTELLERGFLLPEQQRMQISHSLGVLQAIGFASSLLLAGLFIQPLWLAAVAVVFAMVLAVCLHFTLAVRKLIPLYMELREIISGIGRGGFRLTIVRVALGLVTAICRIASTAAFLAVGGVIFLILHFLLHATANVVLMTYLLTLPLFLSLSTMMESWRFRDQDQPSAKAYAELEQLRKKLAPIKVMDSIRNVLLSPEYDETFSQMLALYGVESLLMIV
jgi:hypothetical protein